jgi:hypothetical protein
VPYKNKEDLYNAQKRHRIKIRSKLFSYLSTKACIECGENNPIVLEFDHIDADIKFKSISKMLSGHYSWQSVEEEIKKCQILCANCHRIKTYVQFKSFGRSKPL